MNIAERDIRKSKQFREVSLQLEGKIPLELVNELLLAYERCSQYYFLTKYRPACLEAAFFSEIGIRIMQHLTTSNYTPLKDQIQKFPEEVRLLSQTPTVYHESIRLIIPKILQTVYDLRNKRKIGHTGGDVDENFADATLALNCCNWVLAEMIRIFYTGNIQEAQKLVNSLVEIKLPLIQDFDGFLKILEPKLSVANRIIVLLHHRGKEGANVQELVDWIGKKHRTNVLTSLTNLDEQGYVYRNSQKCYITHAGEKHLLAHVVSKYNQS